MADLEAVLADVSYLMAMEKSKSTPAARASRKITLPDPSVRSVMHKYLVKMSEVNFDKIFNQRIGFLLFKEYCSHNPDNPVQLQFYEKIREFEKLDTDEERIKLGKKIYDDFIMKELVSAAHFYSDQTVGKVQQAFTDSQKTHKLSSNIFEPYIKEICDSLRGDTFQGFLKSDKYTRFCQWKNLELNMTLSMTDFSVHRIIGRGGFGEVYGCRKADTGKMYAMKCLDKKRIKMKKGEALALNERIMLSLVSTGEGCPFIVCMTYAFQTSDKLCFVLDLMNGGDLHYHLTNNGLFKEADVRFYASEIVLGLEHMHSRNIVYRDLKPANILLDENGHVRISDLGLAYDFSQRKPHASVGTHGYMAPEVLAKDEAYDSSADWFSFGCMLYKLLNGHSPFRHHKTKDKREIDLMTMTTDVDLPKTLSDNMKSLLSGLLKREVSERLGCQGRGADEIKEHAFFEGVDWQLVYLQKYPPPLIPPRGEVNAADAFEIGSFDDEDTRTIRLADDDQQRYKDFNMVVSERWQQEVCETVFETTNQETDKRRNDKRNGIIEILNTETDCMVEGNVDKAINGTLNNWAKRYLRLYPNRLEFHFKNKEGVINPDKQPEMISMETVRHISKDFVRVRQYESIEITLKDESTVVFTSLNREGNREDKVLLNQWKDEVRQGFEEFSKKMSSINKKVSKMYGASIEDRHLTYSNSVS